MSETGTIMQRVNNAITKDDNRYIRDQFAAHAMQGRIGETRGIYIDENIAKSAYKMADAMLAEREK